MIVEREAIGMAKCLSAVKNGAVYGILRVIKGLREVESLHSSLSSVFKRKQDIGEGCDQCLS